MTFFNKKNAVSPTNQDFIWVAEYVNGEHVTEFDYQTKKQNSFYSIKKDLLLRFGIIGQNIPLYFDVYGGSFFLDNQKVDFIYKCEDNICFLTNNNYTYKHIITFKDAFSELNPYVIGKPKSNITQYNFGYKNKISANNLVFDIKFLCEVPSNNYVRMNLSIFCNENIEGKLCVMKNDSEYCQIDAPLSKDKGGRFIWTVK